MQPVAGQSKSGSMLAIRADGTGVRPRSTGNHSSLGIGTSLARVMWLRSAHLWFEWKGVHHDKTNQGAFNWRRPERRRARVYDARLQPPAGIADSHGQLRTE